MVTLDTEHWNREDFLSIQDFSISLAEKLRHDIPLPDEASVLIAVSLLALSRIPRYRDANLQGFLDSLAGEFTTERLAEARKRIEEPWSQIDPEVIGAIQKDYPDVDGLSLLAYVALIANALALWALTDPIVESEDSNLVEEFTQAFHQELLQSGILLSKRAQQRGALGQKPLVN